MEPSKDEKSYSIKGGKTIIGSIGAYQEKFGGSDIAILKMPYLMFILKMIDTPSIDYNSKKKKKVKKQASGFGTPISELPPDVLKQMR